LGVSAQDVNQLLAEAFKLPRPTGALLTDVDKGGAAATAGLQSGDIVLAIDGKPIEMSSDLSEIVGAAKPGDALGMDIWRDGRQMALRAKLQSPPLTTPTAAATGAPPNGARLGLSLRPLHPDERGEDGALVGLMVEKADEAATRAGLLVGDVLVAVDGKPVTNVSQLKGLVSDSAKTAALLVQRGSSRVYLAMRLE
jgi:serine protease Do